GISCLRQAANHAPVLAARQPLISGSTLSTPWMLGSLERRCGGFPNGPGSEATAHPRDVKRSGCARSDFTSRCNGWPEENTNGPAEFDGASPATGPARHGALDHWRNRHRQDRLARLIHELSPRRDQPFLLIN